MHFKYVENIKNICVCTYYKLTWEHHAFEGVDVDAAIVRNNSLLKLKNNIMLSYNLNFISRQYISKYDKMINIF